LQTNGPKLTDKENIMPVPVIAAGLAAAAARLAAKKLAIKAGGKALAVVAGKKAATKAVAVSSRNAKKAAEARAAVKAAKSKPPLATPKSGVTVTKKPGTMAENNLQNALTTFRNINAQSGSAAKFGKMSIEAANKAAKAAGKKTKVIKIK
jgi:hypothetical protein